MKKVILTLLIFTFVFLVGINNTYAQVTNLILRVDGLACPFCAFGLEKKIMKLQGYDTYDVDMKAGEVLIGLSEEAKIELSQIQKAVAEAGFTLRKTSIKAKGKIETSEKGLLLIVGGKQSSFVLIDNENITQAYHHGIAPEVSDENLTVSVEGALSEDKNFPNGLIVEKLEKVE